MKTQEATQIDWLHVHREAWRAAIIPYLMAGPFTEDEDSADEAACFVLIFYPGIDMTIV